MIAAYSPCPKWGERGHNLLQGGYVVYRDWPLFWRRYRPCVACGAKVPADEPLPPTTDEWFARMAPPAEGDDK